MCHRSLQAGPNLHWSHHHRPARPRPCFHRRVLTTAVPAVSTSTSTSSSDSPLVELGWRTDFRENYVQGKVLGTGSFGKVHLGIHAATGETVAIKTLPKERPRLTRPKVLEKLQRELTLLDRLSVSPRVIQLLDCYEDEDNVYLITEACSGGDLQKFSDTYGPLTERCLALVALEILQIVQSCHRLGIVHGDVKPANFCIKDEHRHPYAASSSALQRTPWLKAIDFGCSQLHYRHTRLSKRSGTPVYMAPEIFRRDYSFEVDIWSTGVLLYQLFCRQFPFWQGDSYNKALSLDEVAKAITEADIRMDFGPWLTMSAEGRSFMRGCLTRDPSMRLSLDEALEHPWIMAQTAAAAADGGVAGPLVETEVKAAEGVNNIVARAAAAPPPPPPRPPSPHQQQYRQQQLQQQQRHHQQQQRQQGRRDAAVAA
ncbi:hypothetical protein PLESTB_001602500 [Pleodorina starrii]|uniref:Protein kinase domain-containing protein n=1 Tax=Pleodorina starrii TaxID=330485 RepID=A0A9W6BYA9_9CHLO|nr:hypothetical protein PLESTM_000177600 [Pleodorina starrii]GLC60348.1 hypothetical protein PLESTB_001602500 [Pleodorina starrii]GLC69409.1 hypothetical protein PLESTF_000826800 [Pleodorina starrii]